MSNSYNLRIGNKKNYDYQLYKIESVIDEIPEKSYVNGGVLNITLVKYIADHAEEKIYSSKLDRVIKCIINHAEIDFVYAFYDSYLTSIDIPDSVTEIQYKAFSRCLIDNIVIPDSVEKIGNGAFSGCSGFNGKLVLPKKQTHLLDI